MVAGLKVEASELVWPGKYDETGALVEPPRLSLPLQVIEVIKEGRASREIWSQGILSLFGSRPQGPGASNWRNKLVWGENLYVTASLLAEFAGRIQLIYIDPPFATGADFSISTLIGDDARKVEKEQSMIEAKAYRDTWGDGLSSYLRMMAQRLVLLRDLLADSGSIYLHCDYRVGHHLRLLMDEVFGEDNLRGEIIFKRRHAHSDASTLGNVHDMLFFYSKSSGYKWNPQYTPYSQDYIDKYYRYEDPDGRKWLSRSTTAPGGERAGLRVEGSDESLALHRGEHAPA